MKTIVWIVIIVVIAIVLLALLARVTKQRNAERNRTHADELRQEAHTNAAGLAESQRQARAADAEAEKARVQAEEAEARAAEARQGHLQEQAAHEDQLREADRVDPDVDHESTDYQPETTAVSGERSTTDPQVTDDRPTDGGATTGTAEPGATETTGSPDAAEHPAEGTDTRGRHSQEP